MILQQAGHLVEFDVIRGAKSGRLGRVLGYFPSRMPYPSGVLRVLWDVGPGEWDLDTFSALPWDEFELVAQAIDSEVDLEEEP